LGISIGILAFEKTVRKKYRKNSEKMGIWELELSGFQDSE